MDTITVSIDRTGLSTEKIEGLIGVVSYVGDEIQHDTIHILVNGVRDRDGNYYSVVTIGTQTWMAENLNTGKRIDLGFNLDSMKNNGTIDKLCYDDMESNCDVYGGLYT